MGLGLGLGFGFSSGFGGAGLGAGAVFCAGSGLFTAGSGAGSDNDDDRDGAEVVAAGSETCSAFGASSNCTFSPAPGAVSDFASGLNLSGSGSGTSTGENSQIKPTLRSCRYSRCASLCVMLRRSGTGLPLKNTATPDTSCKPKKAASVRRARSPSVPGSSWSEKTRLKRCLSLVLKAACLRDLAKLLAGDQAKLQSGVLF